MPRPDADDCFGDIAETCHCAGDLGLGAKGLGGSRVRNDQWRVEEVGRTARCARYVPYQIDATTLGVGTLKRPGEWTTGQAASRECEVRIATSERAQASPTTWSALRTSANSLAAACPTLARSRTSSVSESITVQ